MKYAAIQVHLKPYGIYASRATTINHAFAAAIAPNDVYDEERVREAIISLGQDPDTDLKCVYCDSPAQTWDHVVATVKNKVFSGSGHRLGNLVPCCKTCNSEKGNKDWRMFLVARDHSNQERMEAIGTHLAKYAIHDTIPSHLPEYEELQKVKQKILDLFIEADFLAKKIREQSL